MEEERPIHTVEHWAAEKHTPDWLLAAARAGNRWAIGKELNEEDFDDALERAAQTPIGVSASQPPPPSDDEA